MTGDLNAQSFSCSSGSSPACLDYGAIVCSRRAKCVANDAACFDSNACDYQGFVCRSKLLEVVRTYDELVEKHKKLVEDYDSLKSDLDDAESETEAAECKLRTTEGGRTS